MLYDELPLMARLPLPTGCLLIHLIVKFFNNPPM